MMGRTELDADIRRAAMSVAQYGAGKQASYWMREYKRLMRKAGVTE